jgi:hypothetical protein
VYLAINRSMDVEEGLSGMQAKSQITTSLLLASEHIYSDLLGEDWQLLLVAFPEL